jgi:hypothetical protein
MESRGFGVLVPTGIPTRVRVRGIRTASVSRGWLENHVLWEGWFFTLPPAALLQPFEVYPFVRSGIVPPVPHHSKSI